MARRSVNTDMWNDPWYWALPPIYKLVWKYLCDRCSQAGIWDVNLDAMEFNLAGKGKVPEPLAEKKILAEMNKGKERIRVIDAEHWYLTDYVTYQWGVTTLHISTQGRQRNIHLELEKYGIDFPVVVAMDKTTENHWEDGKPMRWLPKKQEFIRAEDAIAFWKENFPKVDVDAEMARIKVWMHDNPDRVKKFEDGFAIDNTVYHQFCSRWMLNASHKKKKSAKPLSEKALEKEAQEVNEVNQAYIEYMKIKKQKEKEASDG